MNFNGSGGLMFLIIAGLWIGVFVPSWFKRSQERQAQKQTVRAVRQEIRQARMAPTQTSGSSISNFAERSYRLTLTRRIFSTIAFFAGMTAIGSIFVAVSQIFYWIVTFLFAAIFVFAAAISRAAKRKNLEVLSRASKSRAVRYDGISRSLTTLSENDLISKNPADTRDWEPTALPAPRQRIGELEQPTLAEVVAIEELVAKKPQNVLDATALDEILRRRRANG